MNNQKEKSPVTETSGTGLYPARLEIDYPDKLDRLSTFFRLIWFIPIGIILGLITNSGETVYLNEAGDFIRRTRYAAGGVTFGIPAAAALMILFRQRYPRWWFDFMRELTRFQARVAAYAALLTDQYPSTVEEQSVHLEIDYPDVENDLKRGMPLIKWLLAVPHFIALAILGLGAFFVIIIAWFAILFTGRYPRSLFDYIVGVYRWGVRVGGYVSLLVTDRYPPFSLK